MPPDVADPSGVLPTKAFVVSAALLSLPQRRGASTTRDYVVISDVNSGLYVLDAPWTAEQSSARRPRDAGTIAAIRAPAQTATAALERQSSSSSRGGPFPARRRESPD